MINNRQVDVVVVNYNSGTALQRCIEHLEQSQGVELNITVVDNHSSDESLGMLSNTNGAIKLIKNTNNTGFARACNQGAQGGTAAHIAIINPDCFCAEQDLSQLSEVMHQHPQVGLIGCRVVNQDGSLQAASRRRLPTFWRVVFHLSGLSRLGLFKGIHIKDDGHCNEVQVAEAVNGACFLVRRDVFEQLQGFDEAYPLHFEDLDLFQRIIQHGSEILYHPAVSPIHLKGHSAVDSEQVASWKRQGLLRYFQKHRPAWEHAMAKLMLSSK